MANELRSAARAAAPADRPKSSTAQVVSQATGTALPPESLRRFDVAVPYPEPPFVVPFWGLACYGFRLGLWYGTPKRTYKKGFRKGCSYKLGALVESPDNKDHSMLGVCVGFLAPPHKVDRSLLQRNLEGSKCLNAQPTKCNLQYGAYGLC